MVMDRTVHEVVSDTASEVCTAERVTVSVDQLMQCQDLADAYRMCLQVSGKTPQQVAAEIDLSYEVLSKVLRRWQEGGDRRYMPNDKLLPFMLACGNSIPLQWLMLQWRALTGVIVLPGGEQVRQVDALRLHGRLASIDEKLDRLIEATRGGDGFSMAVDQRSRWLVNEVFDAALEVGR